MNIYKQTKTGNSQLLLIFGFAMTTGEWILKEKPFPDTGKSDW